MLCCVVLYVMFCVMLFCVCCVVLCCDLMDLKINLGAA